MSAPFVDPAAIRAIAWGGSYDRGVAYFRSGAVRRTAWDGAARVLTADVRGSGHHVYRCTILLGAGDVLSAQCSCPVQEGCKHAIAALLASNAAGSPTVVPSPRPAGPFGAATTRPGPASTAAPTWRSLVAGDTETGVVPLALGVELRQRSPYRADDWAPRRTTAATARGLVARRDDLSLAVRPLMRSDRTGAWIRGDASWDAVRRGAARFVPQQARWLTELATILTGGAAPGGIGGSGEWLTLDGGRSTLLWPHLAAARDAGVELLPAATGQTVRLARYGAVAVDVADDGDRMLLRAVPEIEGLAAGEVVVGAVGSTGVYAVEIDRDPVPIVLAPAALSEPLRVLLAAGGEMAVPAHERDAFIAEGLPRLARRATVRLPAGIPTPVAAPPVAVVAVEFDPAHAVEYRISWSYAGRARIGFDEPLDADRDGAAEASLTASLEQAWDAAMATSFAPAGRLGGVETAEFAAQVLPAWRGLPGVRVEGNAPARRYTELAEEPEIRVRTVESDQPDWFDLGVVVCVGERRIPLAALITALSRGTRKLLLADGAYFSLSHPSLQRLRDLLAEAADLDEWEPETTRISRHQTDLWAEFEDLADVSEPALSWRSLVTGLRDVERVPPTPVPTGVTAELRPYQRAGFDWLAFLWRHRLGGVLADDMGLGKTLQLLALAAHIRSEPGTGPVLVVAPTSVLPTWAAEAARFVPGLAVVALDGTTARRGEPVADAAARADIVLTSYTLLRLDADEFARTGWSAVVLDEAQFAKNPRTKLHRAIARLRCDARFAATGTPLENSLTDLWSLLSLTAPGLFPSARRFREEYVQPIEQGRVPENAEAGPFRRARLARLRRRIRPLILRRTKEAVATELPPKQELELRVALEPAHRALYDRVLQRERQKVLGLLDDLDRNRFIVFRSLTLLRMLSLAPVLVDGRHAAIGSSKADALLDRLVEVTAEGHRALIFSQFTSFLALVADRLTAAGIDHEYLDGSTRRRGEVIDRFRRGTAPAFLISLKAGGFGLTLTEADYVFVLDPWWNPAAEAQAVDRSHRIGQTRTVIVYRLIAADTIEEKVLALQQRKARLFQAVVDDDALFAQELTADDIRGLVEP
ncbi:MAG: DEAD/DEAH box helicase [Microbacterium sp.]|uniref:DEAD/DEAH box helicase n=1 Tax=Microbacterium sp. TaxID=51671 RepID=UPI0039E72904